MNRNCLFSKALALLLCAVLLIGYLPGIAVFAAAEENDWESDLDVVETTTEEPETEPPLGSESNPIPLTEMENYLTIAAGETVYYYFMMNGVTMTVSGGPGIVNYAGESIAVGDESFETFVPAVMGRPMPTVFSIENNTAEEMSYYVGFAFPEGTIDNPQDLWDGDNIATIEAGSQGWFFDYACYNDGYLTITVSGDSWMYNVTNKTTSVQSETYHHNDETVVDSQTITCHAGEEIVIFVNTYNPDDVLNNPAGEVNVNVEFKAGFGTEESPFMLTELENTVNVEGAVYYQGYFNGMIMTVTGEGNFSVIYGGESFSAVDGEVSMTVTSDNPRMPVLFAIDGNGEYQVNFTYPAGSMENPAVAVLGDNVGSVSEGSQGYYWTYTAEKDGDLIVTVNGDNWFYTINNLTQWTYGDGQWSDSDPVVNPATITVAAGDEIQIILNTYDPENPWAAPAGEVSFNLAYYVEEEPKEPVAKIGDVTYTSVADALAAATSNQVVELIANATESYVVIPPSVTLQLNDWTLTADYVIGLNGSYLKGTLRAAGVEGAKLIVDQDKISLSETAPAGTSSWMVIPVWMEDHYIFAHTQIYGAKQTVSDADNGTTRIDFLPYFNTFGRSDIINDGCVDNDISVIITANYTEGKFAVSKEYFLTDPLIIDASQNKALYATLIDCNNYEGLQMSVSIVTEAGVVVTWAPAGASALSNRNVAASSEASESATPVAAIGTVTYTSVAEALAAAQPNETVTLIANATESYVVIPPQVTLQLDSWTLTADYVIGLNGSYLKGTLRAAGVEGAKLIVDQDKISLSETAPAGTSSWMVIPVWMEDHYIFAHTQIYGAKQTVSDADNGTTRIDFLPYFNTFGRSDIINDGCVDNDISVIITANYTEGKFAVSKEYFLTDPLIIDASQNKALYATLIDCNNYEGLEMSVSIVTEAGVVVSWAP